MQALATWSFQPWLEGKNLYWSMTQHMLAAASMSLASQLRVMGPPRVYTDSLGKEILSRLCPQADYAVVYNGFFDQYSTDLFALAKIQTYADQTQPYCHVDLDWIWHSGPQAHWRDLDLVVHGWERLDTEKYERGQNRYYNLEARRHLLGLPQILHHPNPRAVAAPNMGLVYMRNMQLNRRYCDLVWQVIRDNPQEFGRDRADDALNICTVEQHFLGFVLGDMPQLRCDVVFPRRPEQPRMPINEIAVHFVGEMKMDRHLGARQYRDNLLNELASSQLIQDLAREIDSLRQSRDN